jgi:hypothetical protein
MTVMAVAVTLPPSDRRHCEQRHSFDSFVVNVVTITSIHSFIQSLWIVFANYSHSGFAARLARLAALWMRCSARLTQSRTCEQKHTSSAT